MLDNNVRYLQIAFNYDLAMVVQILPRIRPSNRILIEAGTPLLKREGTRAISVMRQLWQGHIVADYKTCDGAIGEVDMARAAGATAITIMGHAPTESLKLFIARCKQLRMLSMIDLLGVEDPIKILRPLPEPPNVMVLHKGRDEESTRGKLIQYRQVNRIRSKYDTLISAAGGVDLDQARSAIFNGANIVVANIVRPGDGWTGISIHDDIAGITQKFLETIS